MKMNMDKRFEHHADILIPEGDHYTLKMLRELVQARRMQGEIWEMPEHLSECPLCLEAFELHLQGLPDVPEESRRRFLALAPPHPVSKPVYWTQWVIKAAAIIVVLGLGAMAVTHLSSPALRPEIVQGRLGASGSQTFVPGQSLPLSEMVFADEPTDLRCADGSRIHLDPQTRIQFPGGRTLRSTLVLIEGSIECDIQPQKQQRFVVQTSLGEIRVIGTRFTVTSRHEQVTVFDNVQGPTDQSAGAVSRVATVVVRVSEGKVLVSNPQENVVLKAGQSATLRENQPLIDVAEPLL